MLGILQLFPYPSVLRDGNSSLCQVLPSLLGAAQAQPRAAPPEARLGAMGRERQRAACLGLGALPAAEASEGFGQVQPQGEFELVVLQLSIQQHSQRFAVSLLRQLCAHLAVLQLIVAPRLELCDLLPHCIPPPALLLLPLHEYLQRNSGDDGEDVVMSTGQGLTADADLSVWIIRLQSIAAVRAATDRQLLQQAIYPPVDHTLAEVAIWAAAAEGARGLQNSFWHGPVGSQRVARTPPQVALQPCLDGQAAASRGICEGSEVHGEGATPVLPVTQRSQFLH
mmetsp:Transcript_28597/g.72440  ORF Transcript_28597/g.72440 Transcript_28597/m.72440 type:complete len:282 (+) Transcript_28597:450-1295(+)